MRSSPKLLKWIMVNLTVSIKPIEVGLLASRTRPQIGYRLAVPAPYALHGYSRCARQGRARANAISP